MDLVEGVIQGHTRKRKRILGNITNLSKQLGEQLEVANVFTKEFAGWG